LAEGFSFKVDASQLLRGLKLADAAVRAAVERGMGQAALQWMNDCVMEPPTVPIDTGTLRSSGSVFLQGVLLAANPPQGPSPAPTPATDDDLRPAADQILARVGFNTPYAAKWHEVPANFREPSAGNKYLEAKAAAHAEEYFQIAADVARKEIGG